MVGKPCVNCSVVHRRMIKVIHAISGSNEIADRSGVHRKLIKRKRALT